MKNFLMNAAFVSALLVATGCATGRQIDFNNVNKIQKNISTEADVRTLFGEPNEMQLDSKTGTKILTYKYIKDSSFVSTAVSTTGAIAGGLLASKNIGSGSGRYVSGALGAILGGYAGSEAVGEHRIAHALKIFINMQTSRVVDFNYLQSEINQ